MKSEIAKILLNLKAVALELDPPFTWASGRKSPIYCDNRLIMSSPRDRGRVADGFVSLIKEVHPDVEVIAGTATAGIPHAAFVAERMDLPMVYVRSKAKEHGRQNQIEGKLSEGAKVVLIEDLISTGKSSIQAACGLVDAGAQLLGVVAVFTYGLDVADEQFGVARVAQHALTDFSTLVEVAGKQGALTPAQMEVIGAWRKDPGAWSAARGGAS